MATNTTTNTCTPPRHRLVRVALAAALVVVLGFEGYDHAVHLPAGDPAALGLAVALLLIPVVMLPLLWLLLREMLAVYRWDEDRLTKRVGLRSWTVRWREVTGVRASLARVGGTGFELTGSAGTPVAVGLDLLGEGGVPLLDAILDHTADLRRRQRQAFETSGQEEPPLAKMLGWPRILLIALVLLFLVAQIANLPRFVDHIRERMAVGGPVAAFMPVTMLVLFVVTLPKVLRDMSGRAGSLIATSLGLRRAGASDVVLPWANLTGVELTAGFGGKVPGELRVRGGGSELKATALEPEFVSLLDSLLAHAGPAPVSVSIRLTGIWRHLVERLAAEHGVVLNPLSEPERQPANRTLGCSGLVAASVGLEMMLVSIGRYSHWSSTPAGSTAVEPKGIVVQAVIGLALFAIGWRMIRRAGKH